MPLYREENLQRNSTNHGLMKKHWHLRSREEKLKKFGKKVNVSYTKSNIHWLTNVTNDTYIIQKENSEGSIKLWKNKTKTLYKRTKTLTTDIRENTFPASSSNKELADIFANFFVEKVNKIRSEFQHDDIYNIPTRNCNTLSYFQTIMEEELCNTIKTMNSTTSSNDPCNNKFILNFFQILVPVWTNIINKSIVEGTVLKCWKEAIILSVQKNHKLGTDLTNY